MKNIQKMRILGIDPGTGICGFGVIEVNRRWHGGASAVKNESDDILQDDQNDIRVARTHRKKGATIVNSMSSLGGGAKMVDAGVIATPPHTPLAERLLDIYNSLHEIIKLNHPQEVAIEKLFFSQNITTGISVAEARGVVLLVCRQCELPVFEYSPNEIKKAMAGYGFADKKQMQEMVRLHLGLTSAPKPDDAADALAAAITHSLVYKA